MTEKSPIHLHIEELVLHGFSPGDRYQIGDAMERELARLFTEQPAPTILEKNRAIDGLDAGTFHMTASPRPEATGIQVARAIFGGLRE